MNWQSLFAGILTVLMVLDCVLLVFLVLLQLPKKEAGAGLAFGGAATDALFGAGSGNVLTKITKYMATGFFVLAVLLAIVGKPARQVSVMDQLTKPSATSPGLPPTTPSAPTATPVALGTDVKTSLPRTPAPSDKSAEEAPISTPSTNK